MPRASAASRAGRAGRKQRDFGTCDCETDPFKRGCIPIPFLWGVYLGDEYHEFHTTTEFVVFVSELPMVLYAHNGGKFDYHYLKEYIEPNEKITVINGRLAKFRIGKCEFRDSLNLIPAPLSRFDKVKIDYAKLEKKVRHQHMAEISDYLRADCRILYEVIEAYFAEYGQSLTQAGAAMGLWRERFGGECFRQQTADEASVLRPYYFGGRVECFVTGEHHKKFKAIDRNSAYPNAMLSPHPISPRALVLDHMPTDSQLSASFVHLRCVSDGALPFREDNGSVSFPNDGETRDYYATGHEIIAGLSHNALRELHVYTARVHSALTTFEEYVHHFFSKRKEYKAAGNAALDYFCKIFLNALYGKFGADPDHYDEMLIADEENTQFWGERGYIGASQWGERYLMTRKLPEEMRNYYNVATASSITGQVRAEMFGALKSVVTPYYCDTDGIYCEDVGSTVIGSELGQWKLELQGSRFAIAGKKTYTFRANEKSKDLFTYNSDTADGGVWKVACKGAKLTPHQIIDVANGHEHTYSPIVPTYSIHHPKPRFIKRVIRSTGVLRTAQKN